MQFIMIKEEDNVLIVSILAKLYKSWFTII